MSKAELRARVHGTLVAIERHDASVGGALLIGPSGSGKTETALMLMDGGSMLVADDRVELFMESGVMWGEAPEIIAGMIELRGIGIVRVPYEPRARISAIFDLTPGQEIERVPDPEWYQPPEAFRAHGRALGLPLYRLDGRSAAAAAKIRATFLGEVER